MIILIALLLFLLGHKIPLWITGQKMIDVRIKGGLRQIFFELSGVLFVFFVAFLILTIIGLSTKEWYLLNENVIYGLNFSQPAKKLGFKNGDKIVSINDKEIVEFNQIQEDMLLTYGDVRIGIKRENIDTVIVLTNKEVFGLIKDGDTPFMPRINADTIFNSRNDLVFNERQRSLAKSMAIFPTTVKGLFRMIFPRKTRHKAMGGIPIFQVIDLKAFIHLIAWELIFAGFINVLPIPGLDIGNVIIALIEFSRKKKFNQKRMKVLRSYCIGFIAVVLLLIIIDSIIHKFNIITFQHIIKNIGQQIENFK